MSAGLNLGSQRTSAKPAPLFVALRRGEAPKSYQPQRAGGPCLAQCALQLLFPLTPARFFRLLPLVECPLSLLDVGEVRSVRPLALFECRFGFSNGAVFALAFLLPSGLVPQRLALPALLLPIEGRGRLARRLVIDWLDFLNSGHRWQ